MEGDLRGGDWATDVRHHDGSLTDRPSWEPARPAAHIDGALSSRERRERLGSMTMKDWMRETHQRLLGVRALREELLLVKDGALPFDSPSASVQSTGFAARSGGDKVDRLRNGAALEDRLKKRQAAEKDIAASLAGRMRGMEVAHFSVTQCKAELSRTSGHLWAACNVAEKRMQLRAERPAEETFEDELQEALEQERKTLKEEHHELAQQMRAGQEMREAVETAKAEMLAHKLSLHLDRSEWPKEFLAKTRELEEVALQFASRARASLRNAEAVAQKARLKTQTCMSRRVADLAEMRRHLDGEINQTRSAMADAKTQLERIHKKLKLKQVEPEARQRRDSFADDRDGPALAGFGSTLRSSRSVATEDTVLSLLRRKIQGAACGGGAGRQLDAMLARLDRGNSGQLGEDDVRIALRRTLRIAPTVVTDAEISALCGVLDTEGLGTVSVKGITEFLSSDTDVSALQERYAVIKGAIDKLTQAQEQLVMDMRRKTAAWKIDKSCLLVTPIKGLELDEMPGLPQRGDARDPARRRPKPLEPRTVEKVRSKIRRAAMAAGSRLHDAFGQGHIDDSELRRALRGPLKIPSYAVSDQEIASLCAMLAKGSGVLHLDDFIGFVGPIGSDWDAPPGATPRGAKAQTAASTTPRGKGQTPRQTPRFRTTTLADGVLQPIKTVEQGGTPRAVYGPGPPGKRQGDGGGGGRDRAGRLPAV